MRIRELGEDSLVRKIRKRFATSATVVGIGDDAAIVEIPPEHSIVYCSDLVAEGIHFLRDLHPPDSVGYKAVAVNVSDVGAMGGLPAFFTLSMSLPGDLETSWLDGLLDGVSRACADFGIHLVGGDTSSAEKIFVDVSMIGHLPKGRQVLRSGAKVGDGIYVTGLLGASALGLDRLRAGDTNHPSVHRHLYPAPRHRVGMAVAAQANAMIDISDGLSSDLYHILEESKVSCRIYKHLLPQSPDATEHHVLHGGEEYELLIVGRNLPPKVEEVPLTLIGEITPAAMDSQIYLIDGSQESTLKPLGYKHF